MGAANDANRRKTYRINCGLRATVSTTKRNHLPGTRFKDASREGMCFLSWDALAESETLSICIPDLDKTIKLEASVARCRKMPDGKFEIGIVVDPECLENYDRLHQDLCEVEYYRKAIERSLKRRVSSREALVQWRERFRSDCVEDAA